MQTNQDFIPQIIHLFRAFLLHGGVFLLIVAFGGVATQQYHQARPVLPPPPVIDKKMAFRKNMVLLDTAIEQFRKTREIEGLSFAMMHQNRLVYVQGYGKADGEQPVGTHHQFRIASVSKLITGVAIMHLQEQGKLSLDDCVFGAGGWLSEVPLRDRRAKHISIRHLLGHWGGWKRIAFGDPMFIPLRIARARGATSPPPLDTIIRYVMASRLSYYPGTDYDYSNFGYALLGKIIEKASGKPYETFVQEEILAPMHIHGMYVGKNLASERRPDEVYHFDKRYSNRRLSIYGDGKKVPRPYGGSDLEALAAAGGWVASPAMLMRLVAHIDLVEGREDFLSEESITKMTQRYQPGNTALGWRGSNGKDTWWRTGTLAGALALVVRQNEHTSWCVLINTSSNKNKRFHYEFSQLMERHIKQIAHWPSYDLFATAPHL